MQLPSTTLLGDKDPFPSIKGLVSLFQRKGIRTVFLSAGTSKSSTADLEIAECMGCPLNAIYTTDAELAAWEEVKVALKTHKAAATPVSEFSAGAETKWILPKNIRTFPNGPIRALSEEICKTMSVSNTRIDILKIDLEGTAGRRMLYEILDEGFRPAIVLIRWPDAPNVNLTTATAAGHLQNCGYALIRKEDTKYLYYFVDNDMYATCSWETVGAINPMVDGIVNEVMEQVNASAPKPDEEHSLSAIKALITDMHTLVKTNPVPLSSTLAFAKALGLPEPPNGTYTAPLFSTWISKLFEKMDAMELTGEARATRKELIVSLKNVEGLLEEITRPKVVDASVAVTTDAC